MNSGKPPQEYYPFNSNADRFIELAKGFGLETRSASEKPPLGGLIVWGGTANHAAYISEVINDNTITIHQSGWDTPEWEWNIRNVSRNQNGTNLWGYKGTCLGFIVNPAISEEPEPGPDPADYPPEIEYITPLDSTHFKVSYKMNGVEGITTGYTVYTKWDSTYVSETTYDRRENFYRNMIITTEKPSDVSRVAILLVQHNITGQEIKSIIRTAALYYSVPCINIYVGNKIVQATPYIYTNGQWKECVPTIYTNGQWKEIYEDNI